MHIIRACYTTQRSTQLTRELPVPQHTMPQDPCGVTPSALVVALQLVPRSQKLPHHAAAPKVQIDRRRFVDDDDSDIDLDGL